MSRRNSEGGFFPLNGNGNRSTSKTITELLAMILGVAAIITPMYQGLVALSNRVEDLASHGTPPTNAKMAAMEVKFTEIETQFKNLDERTRRMEDHFAGNLQALDGKMQLEISKAIAERAAAADPKIHVLEREVADLRETLVPRPVKQIP